MDVDVQSISENRLNDHVLTLSNSGCMWMYQVSWFSVDLYSAWHLCFFSFMEAWHLCFFLEEHSTYADWWVTKRLDSKKKKKLLETLSRHEIWKFALQHSLASAPPLAVQALKETPAGCCPASPVSFFSGSPSPFSRSVICSSVICSRLRIWLGCSSVE